MIQWTEIAREHFVSTSVKQGIGQLLPWNPENSKVNTNFKADKWQNGKYGLRNLFAELNNARIWEMPTLTSLLANQPQFDGLRQIILFKTLDNGSYQVKLREDVNLPTAQLHSNLLNHLRRRENQQPGDNILDDDTHGRILGTVNELRDSQAMIVRLD